MIEKLSQGNEKREKYFRGRKLFLWMRRRVTLRNANIFDGLATDRSSRAPNENNCHHLLYLRKSSFSISIKADGDSRVVISTSVSEFLSTLKSKERKLLKAR